MRVILVLLVQDQQAVKRLLNQVDKANGAAYASLDKAPVPVPVELLAAAGHNAAEDEVWESLQEQYIDDRRLSRRNRQQMGQGLVSAAVAAAAAGDRQLQQQQQQQQIDQGTVSGLVSGVVEKSPQQKVSADQ